MSPVIEDELRATFSERAASVRETTDPYARAARAITRSRYRRAMGASALAMTLVASGAMAANLHAHQPAGRSVHVTDPNPEPEWNGAKSWSEWTLRGSLAEDDEFLQAFVASLPDLGFEPDVESHTLFAGDVENQRVVLTLVKDVNQWLLIERSGPLGASLLSMNTYNKTGADPGTAAVAWLPSVAEGGTVITLLADPRVDKVQMFDQGTWRDVALTDGLAIVELAPQSKDVQIRAYANKKLVFDENLRGGPALNDAEKAWEELVSPMLASTPYEASSSDIGRAMARLVEGRFPTPDGLSGEVVWNGELFPEREEPQPAVVFILKDPSGSASQIVVDRWDGWFPQRIQSVPAKTADQLPAVWQTHPQDLRSCVTAIALPKGGLPALTAELWLDGKRRNKEALKVNGVITIDRCAGLPDNADVTQSLIRIRESSGDLLAEWSEEGGLVVVSR